MGGCFSRFPYSAVKATVLMAVAMDLHMQHMPAVSRAIIMDEHEKSWKGKSKAETTAR